MKKEFNQELYELGLPKYLLDDINSLKKGIKEKSKYLNFLLDELYGSINSAYYSGEISKEQADYLRYKYLFRREE